MSEKTITTLANTNTVKIDVKIKDILNRGKIVLFRNKFSGVNKYVTKWNQDEMGDLLAEHSTGLSKWVCPYAIEYDILEVDEIPNK